MSGVRGLSLRQTLVVGRELHARLAACKAASKAVKAKKQEIAANAERWGTRGGREVTTVRREVALKARCEVTERGESLEERARLVMGLRAKLARAEDEVGRRGRGGDVAVGGDEPGARGGGGGQGRGARGGGGAATTVGVCGRGVAR